MIVVTVQYIDGGSNIHNGGTSLHFYNLQEAKLFARNESSEYPGATAPNIASLCKVFDDGIIVEVWENGINITA